MRLVFQIGRHPHMIQTTPAVGRFPILRTVTPPCVKIFARRYKFACEIYPTACRLQLVERLNFNRSMANDIDQLFVTPHVRFKRCNVEITCQYGRFRNASGPFRHAGKEVHFLTEFGVYLAVRNVSARRNIDIFQTHTACNFDADMARLAIGLPVLDRPVVQRHPRYNSNAMVHGLSVQSDMVITQLTKGALWKNAVHDFGFLQTEDIRRMFAQKAFHNVDTGADGIDVPGSNAERGCHADLLRDGGGREQELCIGQKAKPSSRGQLG